MSISPQDPHFHDSIEPHTVNEKIVWGALNPAKPQWHLAHKIGLVVGAIIFTIATAGLGLIWVTRLSRTFSAYQAKINERISKTAATTGILPQSSPGADKDVKSASSSLTARWKFDCKDYRGDTISLEFAEGTSLPASPQEVSEFAARPIPLPLPFDTVAHEKAKERMIAASTDSFTREVVRKTTDALLHITLPMMQDKLSSCIKQANDFLAKRPYGVSVLGEKSNEWILQIALRLGLQPPEQIQIVSGSNTKILSTDIVVLIDDASYSGKQMAKQIQAQNRRGVTKEICVIVPFMSKAAYEKIKEQEKELGIPLTVITSDMALPTYHEVLANEAEIEKFSSLAGCKSSSKANVLAFTDWRRPDIYSSPDWFLKGFLWRVDSLEEMEKIPPLVPDLKRVYAYKPIVRPEGT